MTRIFLYIFFLWPLFACSKKDGNIVTVIPVEDSTAPATFLALGDSYTIGQSVSSSERFPAQTVALLRAGGINIHEPDYIATTGWTSTDLQNAINTQNPAKHTVVTLLIGVNDQYRNHDTTGYRQRFTALLENAVLLADDKKENVFVLSIPDYSVTPFGAWYDTAQIRKEIDWFNAINKSVTLSYNIAYTDITPSSREGRNDASLIAGDGLHPSGLEYKKWAEMLAPLMKEVLQ